jgi:hypothetical protein
MDNPEKLATYGTKANKIGTGYDYPDLQITVFLNKLFYDINHLTNLL